MMLKSAFSPEDQISEIFSKAQKEISPLDGLIERSMQDHGAYLEPDVIEAMRDLKKNNLARFELLRSNLKKVGCRVSELDRLIADDTDKEFKGRPSQADILTQIGREDHLFHDKSGNAYASIQVDGHREIWLVGSKLHLNHLTKRYYREIGRPPSHDALKTAIQTLGSLANIDGPELNVFRRVAQHDGRIYIDLCNDRWSCIEISRDGFVEIDNPPINFVRSKGMKELPPPKQGGTLEDIEKFINASSHDILVLIVSWILAALRGYGPFPILAVTGEQGSSKSTLCRVLRAIIDPNEAPLRTLPRDDRDLFISASHAHILAYDNVSNLPPWMSDAFCRIVTGGGFASRTLYTDGDETIFDACAPIILNGIDDFVTRPDLADRAIFIHLSPIPENRRQTETDFWKDFNEALPFILGVLYSAVSFSLKALPDTKLEGYPRMADFALCATAGEQFFWPKGTFMNAYKANRDTSIATIINGDPVGHALISLLEKKGSWTGTHTQLLNQLTSSVGDQVARSFGWPKNAKHLSDRIRRLAAFFRTQGIEVEYGRSGRNGDKIITISYNHSPSFNFSKEENSASAASDMDNHDVF